MVAQPYKRHAHRTLCVGVDIRQTQSIIVHLKEKYTYRCAPFHISIISIVIYETKCITFERIYYVPPIIKMSINLSLPLIYFSIAAVTHIFCTMAMRHGYHVMEYLNTTGEELNHEGILTVLVVKQVSLRSANVLLTTIVYFDAPS